MDSLETSLMNKTWNLILSLFNSKSKAFHGVDVDLEKMEDQIDSLEKFLESLRDRYEELGLDARNFCGNTNDKSTTGQERETSNMMQN